MARNLILTGGIFHPFDESAPALARLLALYGIESTITEDIEDGLARLAAGGFELLTIYALRWRMLDNEKYQPHRARWGLSLSQAGRDAITAHVDSGRGLLGIHTAAICFDDWPGWGKLLGGAWRWGRSSHPPLGNATVRIDDAAHPITRALPGFTTIDEVYGGLDLEPDVQPLMHATAGGEAGWQPMLWAREVGRGRVAFDALGHDAAALTHDTHRRILARAALWTLGRRDLEVASA